MTADIITFDRTRRPGRRSVAPVIERSHATGDAEVAEAMRATGFDLPEMTDLRSDAARRAGISVENWSFAQYAWEQLDRQAPRPVMDAFEPGSSAFHTASRDMAARDCEIALICARAGNPGFAGQLARMRALENRELVAQAAGGDDPRSCAIEIEWRLMAIDALERIGPQISAAWENRAENGNMLELLELSELRIWAEAVADPNYVPTAQEISRQRYEMVGAEPVSFAMPGDDATSRRRRFAVVRGGLNHG